MPRRPSLVDNKGLQILGHPISTFKTTSRVYWGPAETAVFEQFIRHDSDFHHIILRRPSPETRVTPTMLKSLNVDSIYESLQVPVYEIENRHNHKKENILAIARAKILKKLSTMVNDHINCKTLKTGQNDAPSVSNPSLPLRAGQNSTPVTLSGTSPRLSSRAKQDEELNREDGILEKEVERLALDIERENKLWEETERKLQAVRKLKMKEELEFEYQQLQERRLSAKAEIEMSSYVYSIPLLFIVCMRAVSHVRAV